MTLTDSDVDVVLTILLAEDFAILDLAPSSEDAPTIPAPSHLVDEPYDAHIPGRACTLCNCVWPASEPDAHMSWCTS